MTKTEKIVDRIKKLLALSRSSNEHEAASAAAKAHKLMMEHSIDQAALRKNKPPRVIEFSIGEETRPYEWRLVLIGGLAEAFGCEYYYQDVMGKSRIGPRKARFMFIGPEIQKDAISYMHDFLIKDINRLANKAWRYEVKAYVESEIPEECRPSAHGWKLSFRFGAAQVIANRLIEHYASWKKEQKKEKNEQALVLVKETEALVKQAYEEIKKKHNLRSFSHGRGQVLQSGYDAGQKAGKDIKLASGKTLGAPAKQLKGKKGK